MEVTTRQAFGRNRELITMGKNKKWKTTRRSKNLMKICRAHTLFGGGKKTFSCFAPNFNHTGNKNKKQVVTTSISFGWKFVSLVDRIYCDKLNIKKNEKWWTPTPSTDDERRTANDYSVSLSARKCFAWIKLFANK